MHRSPPFSDRSILINDPDLLDKMRRVEGPHYLGDTSKPEMIRDMNSSQSAKQAYNNWVLGRIDLLADEDPKELEREFTSEGTTGIIIYGMGGWHRYYVRGDGSVVFSARHATEEGTAKAKAVGFEIFR